MTTEVEQAVEQPVDVTEDHSQLGNDADFEAGFAEARGDEPPAQPETPPEETNEPEAEAEPEPQPEPKPDPIAELTQKLAALEARNADLERGIRQQNDKVFGKIGEVVREMQNIKSSNGGVELTEDDLAEMFSDFPELRRDTLKALNLFAKKQGSPAKKQEEPSAPISQAFDPAEVERIAAERAAEAAEAVRKQLAVERLEDQHPDWKNVITTPQWNEWLSKQPQETQEQAANSWDVRFISKLLGEHKASLIKRDTKQKRLEAAVTPQGVAIDGPPATTEADEFAAGFNAIAKRRI